MLALVKLVAIVSFPSQVGVVQRSRTAPRGNSSVPVSPGELGCFDLDNVKISLDSVIEDGRLAVVAPRMALKGTLPYVVSVGRQPW